MNRKLRIGVDNLTQNLKDLTLPSARHTFIGLIAITICVFLNALAIALPFGLCIVVGKTAPLLLLIVTPFICALSVFIMILILSKNKPKESEEIIYARECYDMLLEVLNSGTAYSEASAPRESSRNSRAPRDYHRQSRNQEEYSNESPYFENRFKEDSRRPIHRPSGTEYDSEYGRAGNGGANPSYDSKAPTGAEELRRPNPYAHNGSDFPSEEEVRSFYRRVGGVESHPTDNSRNYNGDNTPSRGNERISVEERQSSSNTAELTRRDSSGETD